MTIDADAAMELYVYGYPLVYCTNEIARLTNGTSGIFPGAFGFNELLKARELLGPDAEFVSPNNDTLYVMAAIDVSAGPIVLHTPDTADRYYVLQFVDAWSNNFAYVGRRATGTAAADYLLTPVGFTGDIPAGHTVIEVPSDVAVIVGRVQVDGVTDLSAVHAVQDGFTLTGTTGVGIVTPTAGVADGLEFWEQFRTYLQQFPPPAADQAFVDLAVQAGLLAEQSPFTNPGPDLVAALTTGAVKGAALIDSLAAGGEGAPGAWRSALHMFDYNLDRCGLGTIDTADWKIADRKQAYVTRAAAARGGLWGNHGYEADYEFVFQDGDGVTLNGANRYTVTFDPPPPADAFWSLTMYDTPRYYLVDNPIGRYSIGDRTPGLRYADDGSVTIYLQTDAPADSDAAANWLPTPSGDFRPILRMYEPGPSVLDGTYSLPAVRRIT